MSTIASQSRSLDTSRFGRSISTPQRNGELAAQPPLGETGELLARNERWKEETGGTEIQGRSLAQLREMVRREALEASTAFTSKLLGREWTPRSGDRWIVTGHQPGFFHPGVWAKNVAAAHLSVQANGVGLNLIIDSDLFTTNGLVVPRGERRHPRLETFPLVNPIGRRPWEEVVVDNVQPFEGFGAAVAAAIEEDWQYRPVIGECWPDAVDAARESVGLRDVLTAMRRRFEDRLQLDNGELNLGRLQESESFRWFVCHLLANCGEFRTIHNEVLAAYRRVYRIRSDSHPVPPLASVDGFIETPLWVWKAGDVTRGRLFARQLGTTCELTRDGEPIGSVRLGCGGDSSCTVEDLAALSRGGWRIRTRALTTTLFVRLCLADLFIHGTGGARYDQMTDELFRRFFHMRPPVFLTVTATERLPLNPFEVRREEERELKRKIRESRFNPDRFDLPDEAADDVSLRENLIRQQHAARTSGLTRAERRARREANRQRYLALREVTGRLSARIDGERAELQSQLERVTEELAANEILNSREWGWPLFPREQLEALVMRIAASCRQV